MKMKSIIEKFRDLVTWSNDKKFYESNSNLVKMFSLDEDLTDDDLVNISHKNKAGVYVTRIVRLSELKKYINSKSN